MKKTINLKIKRVLKFIELYKKNSLISNNKILHFNKLIESIENNINKKLYSTLPISPPLLDIKNNNTNNTINSKNTTVINNNLVPKPEVKIDPQYISGLTQADGSFNCGIRVIKSKDKFNLRFRPKFDLVLDKDSINVLKDINLYFGCGSVSKVKSDGSVSFVVSNLTDLKNVIIPHFLNYPVFFNKLHAFQLFVKIVKLMENKNKYRDRVELLRLAISMNTASRRTQEQINHFYSILGISSDKILPNIPDIITTITSKVTPAFLTGMIDGDGSFYLIFTNNLKIIPVIKQCYGSNCAPFEEIFKKYLGDIGKVEILSNLRI